MTMNKRWSLGSTLLVPILLGHSIILLLFEPAMGFERFEDFFDLAKVVPALSSAAWFAGNTLHVALGATLLRFQAELRASWGERRDIAADFCFAAAPLFVIVGLSGFVGERQLDIFADNPEGRNAALYGLLAVRTNVLGAAIALFGMMILAISAHRERAATWLRILGIPIGLTAVVFVLAPAPIPLLLLAWVLAFNFGRIAGA